MRDNRSVWCFKDGLKEKISTAVNHMDYICTATLPGNTGARKYKKKCTGNGGSMSESFKRLGGSKKSSVNY